MTEVKIVVVDDHRILRDGLCALLVREPGFAIVGDTGDALGAIKCVEQNGPDVVLLDIALPDENGLALAQQLLAVRPKLKIIILSANCDESQVDEALRLGSKGYVCKEEAMTELVRAIRTVMDEQTYLSPHASTALVQYLNRYPSGRVPEAKLVLSPRELEVLKLLVEGLRNKEIAGRLGVGTKSVETYRARLMAKAGCSSPAALVRFALKEKLAGP
jgi:DNA-binding NarL/FixJ family response regulator